MTADLLAVVEECAEDVNEELPVGMRENAYHQAMLVALSDAGVEFTTEATIPVTFRGLPIARMHPDLIVTGEEGRYLVELKVSRDGTEQLQGYLHYAEANDMDDVVGGIMVSFGTELDVLEC